MKKFTLGHDPRTGRARMSAAAVGTGNTAPVTRSARYLPMGPRERLVQALALFTAAGWRDRELVELVQLYGVSACCLSVAGIPFSILLAVELTGWSREPGGTPLAGDPLWYGILAGLALATGFATRKFAQDMRRSRGSRHGR